MSRQATSRRVRQLALGLAALGLAVACGNRADEALVADARLASLEAGSVADDGPAAPVAVDQVPGAPAVAPELAPDVSATEAAPGAAPTTGPAAAPVVTDDGGSGAEEGASVDTRFAPPGGNGGATDVGVTADEIVIGNVADITGAVAGLFADVQKAAQAYELYFNSTVRTIWGRRVRLIPLDTQLSRNGNFSAYTDLCSSAFMAVASQSAFDEGIVAPVKECGLPDLRTTTTNPETQVVSSVFSTDSMKPNRVGLTELEYWKTRFPDAIGHAGYVLIDNNTTRAQTALIRSAAESIGYSFDVYEPVDLAAISYKTTIRKMKEAGVRFVTFMGAYQQVAKLAREMVEEGFHPDVFANLMNVYDPRLIAEGGRNLEVFPVQLQVVSQLTEEIAGSPESQIYRQWLKYIDPEAEPTGLGNYGWSAMKLAYELLAQIGPEPTRAKMIDAIEDVRGWTGGGLIPPQDIGTKEPSPCMLMIEIRDGQFVRVHPTDPNTFDCSGDVITAG